MKSINLKFVSSKDVPPMHGEEVIYMRESAGFGSGVSLRKAEVEYFWVGENGVDTSYNPHLDREYSIGDKREGGLGFEVLTMLIGTHDGDFYYMNADEFFTNTEPVFE